MSETRTRTYDYQAPAPELLRDAHVDGAELLRRIRSGALPAPPIAHTLGFELVDVDPGVAVFEGTPAEWQYNPLGSVHGGWMATLLDSALACAVHTTLPAERSYTTTDLQVRFHRPLLAGTGVVRAEAKVLHAGKRLASSEARLVGKADGKLYASATSTCIIV
jgi:uncharacterized protein (TIGR00369 family)